MTALLTALLLAAAPKPAAAKPATAAAPPAASPAPAAAAAEAAPAGPPAADVVAFLWTPGSTAARDGASITVATGPGAAQLKISGDALARRDEHLELAGILTTSIMGVVRAFYEAEGSLPPDQIRAKLASLAEGPIDEAQAAWLEAVDCERRRLFFVSRAVAEASADGVPLPGVDADLVERRARAIQAGALVTAVQERADGYRSLALSIVAWLDGDRFGALRRMQTAAERMPDVAITHALLGSFYLVFDQREPAVLAWRRALALDPRDAAVRDALREYDRKPQQR